MKTFFGCDTAAGRKAGIDMENTEKEPRGFYVEKGSFFAHAAVTLLVLSMAARLLGTLNLWGDMPKLITQVLLPVGSSLLFIVFILLLGRIALWTTILPVLGGAAFFILSVFGENTAWPYLIAGIVLAFLASFLYTATLFGMLRRKWLLVLVFTLTFAYLVYRAVPLFANTENPISFIDGMTLLSSLAMVFAMLLATLSFRRKKAVKAEPELPKIKDPVVIPPENAESAEAPAIAQEAAPETEVEPFFAAEAEPEQLTDPAAAVESPNTAEEAEASASEESGQK